MNEVPRVFIGSSRDAETICRNLQVELERAVPCEVTVWTQGAFAASDYTLESLSNWAMSADFAVLVATPDDTVSRSDQTPEAMPRDNVIFELGLFIGAIGRERTYIVADQSAGRLALPTDLAGLTWLPYKARSDGNERAAVSEASLKLSDKIRVLGPLSRQARGAGHTIGELELLTYELDWLVRAADSQGWRVRSRTPTVLRLVTPRKHTLTFSISAPALARIELRRFVKRLQGHGFRVTRSLQRPPDQAPAPPWR